MRKRDLFTIVTAFVGTTAFGQNFIQTNVDADRAVLGNEPEELLEEGSISTQEGNIDYNTAFFNGLHAYFSSAYPYTAVTSKVGDNSSQYSTDELNAMGSNNIYGIQVDTIDNKIMDMNGSLINSFTDISDFYTKMNQLIEDIVEEDIDVTPVGVEERIKQYLGGNITDKIFPNPTKGEVNVDLKDGLNNIMLGVYDVSGRQIKEYQLNSDTKINLDDLSNGLYILQFYNIENGKKETQKLIIN